MISTLHVGDCLDVLRSLSDASVDNIITDPPYALGFMGKRWDATLPELAVWQQCLRVAKPGAHLLCFGSPRTYHRLICAIEDAGWDIIDCLMWLHGQGFPKGKSQLKPAYEPIVLARKKAPHVTPLQIDACRIPGVVPSTVQGLGATDGEKLYGNGKGFRTERREFIGSTLGRWPANVLLSDDGDEEWRRYFYCAKASKREREAGCEGLTGCERQDIQQRVSGSIGSNMPHSGIRRTGTIRNTHPTVKPLQLMRYLTRLVAPSGSIVLDPFLGSGTTGMAAAHESCHFIGCDTNPEYVTIAHCRIDPIVSASLGLP